MNALNGVWSDTEILQIITQQELQKLITNLQGDLILKIQKSQSKLETFRKLKTKFCWD